MDNHKLFSILFQKKDFNFNSLNTDFITSSEKLFLDKLSEDSKDCFLIAKEGNLHIFHMQGIIFLAQPHSWETYPEGPNNEPPGIQSSIAFRWCTESLPLETSKHSDWEKVKKEVLNSLRENKKDYYL